MEIKFRRVLIYLVFQAICLNFIYAETNNGRWSEEKIWEWYNSYDWLLGTNFNPSTSINQLEFWQAETFDLETIDRELRWSAEMGMNTHRVFLHNLLWEQDAEGFLDRLDKFLEIADGYGIKTMFVLLDDVWNPLPKLGKQPEPLKGVHNSRWVQSPGSDILGDLSRHDELESYIKGVVGHFSGDERVLCWDLYNEPGNVFSGIGRPEAKYEVKNKPVYTLALLNKVVKWVRDVEPSQPITSGIWAGRVKKWGSLDKLPDLDRFMIENSDIISFHTYQKIKGVKKRIAVLKKYGRPMLCTEYMARTQKNVFEEMLPLLKEHNVGGYNWGFVAGKTNTIYPWMSWVNKGKPEPKIWFHDILRPDGTPFSQEEVDLIKKMTGR